jgi:hypothetical protein
MSDKFLDALERAARTFAQTFAGALLALLAVEGASWDDVPKAALAAAFAGFLAVLAAYAVPAKSAPPS